jgi:HD-like signal output (HDOD) protein
MAPSSKPSETHASPSDPLLGAVLRLVSQDGVKVPPIPGVVARLSEHLANPSFELRDVAQLVGTDQALAAHILRCASSTLMAARTQVTSLQDAVNRIGSNGLFSLAVSFSLGREVMRRSPLQSLRRDVFRNAATTAEFCRRLAPRLGAEPEAAFLCGLLASFGLTVALGAIEQAIANQPVPSRPAESWMEMARECEARIASEVPAQWGMPKLVGDVIAARRGREADAHVAPFVAVLDVSEKLTALFYRDAAPSVDEIAREAGCDLTQAADIAHFLPDVAAAVCALGAATDDLKLTHTMHIPIVEAPPTTLKGRVVTVNIPATVERRTGDQHLVCVGLAADGIVAHGTQALPLNQVVKCKLLVTEEDLDLVAFVAAVVREDGDYRFEIKPMGLTGPNALRWQQLRGEGIETRRPPPRTDAPPRASGSAYVSLRADRGSPLHRLGSWLRRKEP